MKNLKDILYIPDYMSVLCIFNENKNMSVNQLHYEYRVAYSTLHEFKKIFLQNGWIVIENEDKKHVVKITGKGQLLVDTIYELFEKLGVDKQNIYDKLKLRRGKGGKYDKKVSSKVSETTETINDGAEEVNSGEDKD